MYVRAYVVYDSSNATLVKNELSVVVQRMRFWCQDLNLKLNIDKTHTYTLGARTSAMIDENEARSRNADIRDLSLLVSEDLSWGSHIDAIVNVEEVAMCADLLKDYMWIRSGQAVLSVLPGLVEMERREVYTTQQPDGTYVTTTTRTQTKYAEGLKNLDKLHILQFLCLVVISLITSVFGPGPFKGILFGQTLLLIFAGVAMCFTFIFLIVYFFTLNETHLDFWPWRTTDLVFSATCCFSFIILAIVEAYYSTGSWSNNCNDIGSDGFIHNGCRIIYEWAFASVRCPSIYRPTLFLTEKLRFGKL
ncbi:synaptophysin / synaptoporin [Ancylostoma ceylanicum]|uniref:Synaptophysin / synaptoporin n=1 Tax=Ancylostoma ceylanicum TaxID=53326 RepID=A0A0D6L5T3_9BILA|nr:synaptophysin / synaptoporin [Ancylostoma ceylanicum]